MDDPFYRKVRAAAVAGWWTLLVAVGLALFIAGGFLWIMNGRPAWVTRMWGGLSWETIQMTGLWMIGVYRVFIWIMFLLVIWLTIWSAKLKRIS
jgi:hypothetical protein